MPSKQSFSQRGGTKVTTEEGSKTSDLLIVRFQIYPKAVSFGYFNLKSPIWNLRLPLELSTFSNVSESRAPRWRPSHPSGLRRDEFPNRRGTNY
jgi:hypothetical protein